MARNGIENTCVFGEIKSLKVVNCCVFVLLKISIYIDIKRGSTCKEALHIYSIPERGSARSFWDFTLTSQQV